MLVFQSFESPQCLTAAVLEAVAARADEDLDWWRFARRWRRGCRGVPPRVCRWWPGLDRVLLLERRYGCNNEDDDSGFWSCSHFVARRWRRARAFRGRAFSAATESLSCVSRDKCLRLRLPSLENLPRGNPFLSAFENFYTTCAAVWVSFGSFMVQRD